MAVWGRAFLVAVLRRKSAGGCLGQEGDCHGWSSVLPAKWAEGTAECTRVQAMMASVCVCVDARAHD